MNNTNDNKNFNKNDIIFIITISFIFLIIISVLCFVNKLKDKCNQSRCCNKTVYVNEPYPKANYITDSDTNVNYISNFSTVPPHIGFNS